MRTSPDAYVDFNRICGKLNPALHGSNSCPILSSRKVDNTDNEYKMMRFHSARTHDWALWNVGQRMIDTYFVFPLMKLDPADPTNYYFKSSDAIIKLCRDTGAKVFYRLGASIEHSGDIHFNSLVPEDFHKYAEILAGIVRHYREGWADGFHYDDMEYWEIWNEPDIGTNMWTGTAEEFQNFFVIVLKRLKQEFPAIKVGGPALTGFNPEYFTQLLLKCREAGVAPDFISWHEYGSDVKRLTASPERGRKLLDSMGFHSTELSINEWHYIISWDGIQYRLSPELFRRTLEGPTGLGNIDSAVFNLAVLAGWQKTPLNSAFYYGANPDSVLGFRDVNHAWNKNFFSMVLFGELITACSERVESDSGTPSVWTLGALSPDGSGGCLLVADYRGGFSSLEIEVNGMENAEVSCKILDAEHDNTPIPVMRANHRLTLVKNHPGSAAFLLTFER